MAPDPSPTRPNLEITLPRGKDRRIEEKVMPLPEEPEEEFSEDLRRPTLLTIWIKYMSFDGAVTMLLSVVAPQTPETIDGFEETPKP